MKKNKAKANRKAQELSNKEQKGKLIKEEKEHIDNMVVLATAIGLVGAIVLLYLYQYLNSSYALASRRFVDVLTWLCYAGVLACVILYFVKNKKKNYLKAIPYFVGISLVLMFLAHYSFFAQKFHIERLNNLKTVVILIYIIIALYLIATYVFFGIKSYQLSKKAKQK